MAIAGRCARRIERTGTRWGKPLAGLLRGALAAREGKRVEAQAILARAARDADIAEMPGHAAVARRRQGELAGGEEGAALIATANAWMAAHGVRNPDRFIGLVAPGFAPT
jgi:predicted TIM-barrel fold metal-dependent hydrolase